VVKECWRAPGISSGWWIVRGVEQVHPGVPPTPVLGQVEGDVACLSCVAASGEPGGTANG
jgi:hypothetical protein